MFKVLNVCAETFLTLVILLQIGVLAVRLSGAESAMGVPLASVSEGTQSIMALSAVQTYAHMSQPESANMIVRAQKEAQQILETGDTTWFESEIRKHWEKE